MNLVMPVHLAKGLEHSLLRTWDDDVVEHETQGKLLVHISIINYQLFEGTATVRELFLEVFVTKYQPKHPGSVGMLHSVGTLPGLRTVEVEINERNRPTTAVVGEQSTYKTKRT